MAVTGVAATGQCPCTSRKNTFTAVRCGDAIRKRYADPVRAAYANFEAPDVGSHRTPAHGPPRRRYISSQGNQQTAAQSTSSAVEAPRHNGLFLGDFRIRPIGTQSKSIQWT